MIRNVTLLSLLSELYIAYHRTQWPFQKTLNRTLTCNSLATPSSSSPRYAPMQGSAWTTKGSAIYSLEDPSTTSRISNDDPSGDVCESISAALTSQPHMVLCSIGMPCKCNNTQLSNNQARRLYRTSMLQHILYDGRRGARQTGKAIASKTLPCSCISCMAVRHLKRAETILSSGYMPYKLVYKTQVI